MKTTTKFWAALAAIFGVLCIVSCSEKNNGDDDEPDVPPGTTALVSRIENSDGTRGVTFDYDTQDRLSKMSFFSDEDDDNYDITYHWSANTVVVKYSDDPDITCSLASDGTVSSAVGHYDGGTITEYYKYGSNDRGPFINYYECLYTDHANLNQTYHVEWKNGCVSKVYDDNDRTLYSYTNIENKINIDLAEILDEGIFETELSSFTYLCSAGIAGIANKYLPSRVVNTWSEWSEKYTNTIDYEYTLNDRGLPTSVTCDINDEDKPGKSTFKITYK